MRNLLKRPWLWATVLLAVVGAGYLVIPLNETGVSKANFDRIQNGWSEDQVTRLLGDCASTEGLESAVIGGPRSFSTTSMWSDDEGNASFVNFHSGLVTDKT